MVLDHVVVDAYEQHPCAPNSTWVSLKHDCPGQCAEQNQRQLKPKLFGLRKDTPDGKTLNNLLCEPHYPKKQPTGCRIWMHFLSVLWTYGTACLHHSLRGLFIVLLHIMYVVKETVLISSGWKRLGE